MYDDWITCVRLSLLLIAYTNYDESSFEILKRARFLLGYISTHVDNDLEYDLNDKVAFNIYLIFLLNMLHDDE